MGANIESYDVAATLASQRIIAVSGEGAFYPTSTATPVVGISIDTVIDTNQALPVQSNGIAKLLFNDSVTARGLVGADSAGRAIPFTPATIAAWCIGQLSGDKVDTTGTVAQVIINPQFISQDS